MWPNRKNSQSFGFGRAFCCSPFLSRASAFSRTGFSPSCCIISTTGSISLLSQKQFVALGWQAGICRIVVQRLELCFATCQSSHKKNYLSSWIRSSGNGQQCCSTTVSLLASLAFCIIKSALKMLPGFCYLSSIAICLPYLKGQVFGKAAKKTPKNNCSSISEELVSDKELMFRYVAQHGPVFFLCSYLFQAWTWPWICMCPFSY